MKYMYNKSNGLNYTAPSLLLNDETAANFNNVD